MRGTVNMMAVAIVAASAMVPALVQPLPVGAENPRFVREFITETQGILGDVDVVRKQFETTLGDPRQGRPPTENPAASVDRFHKSFGGTMEKFGGRVKKLTENRQKAERSMSSREAQFTSEVHGDLMKLMQQVALTQLLVNEVPVRRVAFFEDLGKQTDALRKKLREYQ